MLTSKFLYPFIEFHPSIHSVGYFAIELLILIMSFQFLCSNVPPDLEYAFIIKCYKLNL